MGMGMGMGMDYIYLSVEVGYWHGLSLPMVQRLQDRSYYFGESTINRPFSIHPSTPHRDGDGDGFRIAAILTEERFPVATMARQIEPTPMLRPQPILLFDNDRLHGRHKCENMTDASVSISPLVHTLSRLVWIESKQRWRKLHVQISDFLGDQQRL